VAKAPKKISEIDALCEIHTMLAQMLLNQATAFKHVAAKNAAMQDRATETLALLKAIGANK
jgi:hypothetical protein